MHALYTCITQQHDLTLVALAVAICCLGVGSGFALGREAMRAPDARAALVWTAASVVAATSAIWATHFVAMLAFEPGLPFGFDIPRTILSFLVALAMIAAAVRIVVSRRSPAGCLIGGAIAGLAISAMHYTGMGAYRVQGHFVWDAGFLALSVLSGLSLACVAAMVSLSPDRRIRQLSPVFFILAIALDHFFGMSAVGIAVDPALPLPDGNVNKPALVLLVANVALVIVGLSCAALWLATRDKRQQAAEELRLRDLADIAVEGLMICRDGVIVSVNRSLERAMDCRGEDMVGRKVGLFLPGMDVEAVPTEQEADAYLHCAASGAIPVKVVAQRIGIGGRPHLVIGVRDQRERLRNDRRMMQLAHRDALTGLANRLSFNEALAERLAAVEPGRTATALLMMDLDRFKAVNDSLGHGMGDELLRRVGGRLRQATREGGFVARLGGDEFAILVATAPDLAAARAVAEDAIDLLSRPFLIDGHVIDIATSVGIALAPSDGSGPGDLSRNADLALYRAKQEGGSTYRFFEPEMNARVQARRSLELSLRRAVARGEFEVHYQPLADARTGAFTGAEALARWRQPERGIVSPAEFIPLAEEIGLIGAIGEWVLRTACAEAAGWPPHLSVAVNLSPIQLRDARLAATVAAVLDETGLAGSRLELEVTENALLQDDGQTEATLHELRALGIRISMDDFGTGYSSLSYLRRFPFDKIKIDQSFVRQTPGDPESVAIVQAVASLGAKLGMTVTVEGVETEEQRDFTVAEGCDQIQGYLISRPVPAEQVRGLFSAAFSRAVA